MWSVIVVAKGMWSVTEKFLNSLEETIGVEHEIIYIDNGSPNESSWMYASGWKIEKFGKENGKMLSVIYPKDECLSKCWNEGIRYSSDRSKYVLVANNDIVFRKSGWREQFEQALNQSGLGVVGLVGMSWRNIPFIQGCLMAFQRETFDRVGPFDERYLFTCEDVDWCKRAQDAGYQIRSFENLRDDGTIEHAEGATRNFYKDMTVEMQRRAHLSRVEFCYRWTYPDISIHD